MDNENGAKAPAAAPAAPATPATPSGLDAPPGIADLRDLRLHALAGVAECRHFLLAPPGPDPTALAPDPPSRHARVPRPLGVLECSAEGRCAGRLCQPAVPRVQVHVRHWVILLAGHRLRLVPDGPPKIRDVEIHIVHHFQRSRLSRRQQHGRRPAEWLDVLSRRAQSLPHLSRNLPLPPKPWKRCQPELGLGTVRLLLS